MHDATFGIIIFGDSGSGKTTLVNRLITNSFLANRPKTIGVDFYIKAFSLGKKNIKLYIWDFGNEKRFKFLLPTYLHSARGGIFMYDITNYFSLAHIDDWLSIIRKEKGAHHSFPIILVGGKADLVDEREVSAQEGKSIAKSRDIDGFIECSSKTGENVEKTFKVLTWLMMLIKT